MPRPKRLTSPDDLFPCCLTCVAVSEKEKDLSEPLWHQKAYAGWLQAEWFWDFGFTLPEEFISFGIGITPPPMPVERDRVFVHKSDFSRGILDVSLEKHAECGEIQHQTKVSMYSQALFANVLFEGQFVADRSGGFYVAVPRNWLFGNGKETWQRFIFQPISMPYNFNNILIHGDNIKMAKNNKILLNGVQI